MLSAADRDRGRARTHRRRAARTTLLATIRAGNLTVPDLARIVADSAAGSPVRLVAGSVRVRSALLATRGMTAGRADMILAAAGIVPTATFRRVGPYQIAALIASLGGATAASPALSATRTTVREISEAGVADLRGE